MTDQDQMRLLSFPACRVLHEADFELPCASDTRAVEL